MSNASARLDDFRPLLPAEVYVVDHLQSGSFDRLGDGSRPGHADPGRVVRAPFLRFLMLGGEDGCRPHEKGVRISGAWITDILDLEACRVFRDIGLNDCHFEAAPILRSAIINRVFLDGSLLPGLFAERLEVRGGVYLRGAEVNGAVRISESRFGGNLECDGAAIVVRQGAAIDAQAIELRNVLVRGATIRGGVNLSGARLAADLDCTGATLTRAECIALDAAEIECRGSVSLRNAAIEGEVRLVASLIAGDLDCSGASIANAGRNALDLGRTTVTGAFFLRRDARMDGTLDMAGASVGTIHDEAACWPRAGDLKLNRCRYDAFIEGPVDARSRLDWLSRQDPARWGEDFWPQPYEQLALTFDEMGHEEEARAVLVVKERLQRQARRARAKSRLWRAVLAAKDGLLAVTVLYGRQPLLALLWLVLFWAVGVAVFHNAERLGAVMPNSAVVLRSPEWTLCGLDRSDERLLGPARQATSGLAEGGQNQLTCFREQWEASSYPRFNPWVYSLDVLLPVLEMGQRSYWRPNPAKPGGGLIITYYYFQALIGWTLSLLAVAGFSGLVRSR